MPLTVLICFGSWQKRIGSKSDPQICCDSHDWQCWLLHYKYSGITFSVFATVPWCGWKIVWFVPGIQIISSNRMHSGSSYLTPDGGCRDGSGIGVQRCFSQALWWSALLILQTASWYQGKYWTCHNVSFSSFISVWILFWKGWLWLSADLSSAYSADPNAISWST